MAAVMKMHGHHIRLLVCGIVSYIIIIILQTATQVLGNTYRLPRPLPTFTFHCVTQKSAENTAKTERLL